MKITVKRKTNAPAERLWSYLADFSNIHRFHPFLKDSFFINGSDSTDVGSARQCNFKDGSEFKETITEWNDGSNYTIEAEDSTGRIKSVKATVGVNPIDSERSEVYMTIDMIPANKIMQPMMYLMFKNKVIPAVLKGLEDLYNEEQKINSTVELAS
jgi:ribosome-associated toxin RatA of RatAB toxin-antitoxin module